MKLGKQGEINILPKGTAIAFESKPTELNATEGKSPFEGSILVQPHSVKLIWEVMEGKREFVSLKSGRNRLVIKYQPEKTRVRIRFINETKESSYIVFGSALNRLKDILISAVQEAKVASIKNGGFSAIRVGGQVILKNDNLEYYLDEENILKLKDFILKNFLLKEPVPMEGKKFAIDEEGNLIYKGLILPKEEIKYLYLFIL